MEKLIKLKRFFSALLILVSTVVVAQSTISGTVLDEAGLPIPGANVVIAGTSQGASSDFDGKYSISNLENGTYTLTVSYVGYKQATEEVTIQGSDKEINFLLSEDASALDEVVLTGSVGDPRSRIESSISVSSIGLQQIEQSAPRTSGEVFRNIPGIRAESSGGDGNGNYNVRGVPVSSGGSRYLQIQEDGLPLNLFGDTSFGNSDNWLRIDSNIQSVEAIRGGSASTITTNGPAGIINMVSKTGKTKGGSLSTSAGLDYGSNRLDFEYGEPLENGLSYHIGGFMRAGEGPREAGYTANKGGQIKANVTKTLESGYVRAYVKILNDRSAMYLPMPMLLEGDDANPTFGNLPGFDITTDSQHTKFLQENVGLDYNNNTRRAGDVRTGNNPISKAAGLEFSFDLGDGWKIKNKGRLASNSGEFSGPFTANFGQTSDVEATVRGLIPATATGALVYADGDREAYNPSNGLLQIIHLFDVTIEDMSNIVNDFKITKKLGEKVNVTAGYFTAVQNTKTSWQWATFLSEVKGGGEARLVDVEGYSRGGKLAYGNPLWDNCCNNKYNTVHTVKSPYFGIGIDLSENLNFDGSLRYDSFNVDGTIASFGSAAAQDYDINGNGIIEDIETSVPFRDPSQNQIIGDSYSYVSYSLGLNYKLSDNAAVFGRYSLGASGRAPDRNGYDTSGVAATQYDQVSQFEVGYKRKMETGFVNLTGFMSNTDEDAGTALNQTVGNEFKALGLELEGAYAKNDFSILGSITWTDAEIVEDRASGTGANNGKTPRRQADFVYNLSPTYNFGKTKQHVLGLSILGTSKSFATDGNDLIMPGYAYINFLGSVGLTKGLSLSLNINNLFDTVGITEVEGVQGAAPGGNRYVTARSITGRSTSLSLRYKF